MFKNKRDQDAKLTLLLESTRLWDDTSELDRSSTIPDLSMALPTSYSNLISDLNRDVLRAQPADSLQFCANWFSSRLESERSTGKGDEVRMTDTTPPPSARSVTGDILDRSTHSDLNGGGYTFGGNQAGSGEGNTGRGGDRMEVERLASPFTTVASPFSRVQSSSKDLPPALSSVSSPGRARAADATAAPRVAASPSTPLVDSDEDVFDPRDDPSYNPNNTSFGIPLGYNLGRRTSVSAESLDPNAPPSLLPKTVIPKTPSQRARIESSISNNLLFRNLDEGQYKDVLNAMKEVAVSKGTQVIVQGAVGDFFYVVEAGTFEVWVRSAATHTYTGPGASTSTPGTEKQVASYGPGGSFGELALMYNAPRAATVIATTEATMWALDRVTFRSILMEHTSRKRKMYETFLGEVPILASLNTKERAKIADALEEKVYDDGDRVVVEGDIGKNFYIIESGTAEVSKKKQGGMAHEEEVLGTLGKGDYFGELALLNSAPRAATVRALGRLRVATLGEKAFTRLLGPVIDILQRQAEHSYGAHVGSGPTPVAVGA